MDSELRIRIKAIKEQRYFNRIVETFTTLCGKSWSSNVYTIDNSIYGPASFTNDYTQLDTLSDSLIYHFPSSEV